MIGKVLDYQAKQITYNVYVFLKKRKADTSTREHKQDINLIDTVSEVTGLSKSSVTRIIREGNAMKAEGRPIVFRETEKVKHVRKKRIEVDEHTEGVIRRKVIQFYTTKDEVPSVRRLNALLKKENILLCSDEYLRQLLHKLGFTNAENDSTGEITEKAEIITQRLAYLQAIREFRANNRAIFFLNDTKEWMKEDNDYRNNAEIPSLVIVHASGDEGFADGSLLMLKMRPKSDSDEDLNFEQFENYDWMKDSVMPNLPSSSVIVMNIPQLENTEATPEDEKPTASSTRATLESWLNRNKVPFKETDSKANLYQMITSHQSKMKYSFSKLLSETGLEVLYLPTNHSDLNPPAIVWDEIKKKIKGKMSPQKLFNSYPKDKWIECFQSVVKHEDEYYAHDMHVDVTDLAARVKKERELENEKPIKQELESGDDETMDSD